jgi:hypothetical protein
MMPSDSPSLFESDPDMDLLGYATPVLMASGHDYLCTGLGRPLVSGLVGDYCAGGRYLESDSRATGTRLRLTVFNDDCSIRVDEEVNEEPTESVEEHALLTHFCLALNEEQDFFRASLSDRSLVVTSVLERARLITEQEVDDLLLWSSKAAKSIDEVYFPVVNGERTPFEAARDALADFTSWASLLCSDPQFTEGLHSRLVSDITGGAE